MTINAPPPSRLLFSPIGFVVFINCSMNILKYFQKKKNSLSVLK